MHLFTKSNPQVSNLVTRPVTAASFVNAALYANHGAPTIQPSHAKPKYERHPVVPSPSKCTPCHAMYRRTVHLRKPIANLPLSLLLIKIWIVLLLLTLLTLALPILSLIPRLCLVLNVLRALPVDMCSWMCRLWLIWVRLLI